MPEGTDELMSATRHWLAMIETNGVPMGATGHCQALLSIREHQGVPPVTDGCWWVPLGTTGHH